MRLRTAGRKCEYVILGERGEQSMREDKAKEKVEEVNVVESLLRDGTCAPL